MDMKEKKICFLVLIFVAKISSNPFFDERSVKLTALKVAEEPEDEVPPDDDGSDNDESDDEDEEDVNEKVIEATLSPAVNEAEDDDSSKDDSDPDDSASKRRKNKRRTSKRSHYSDREAFKKNFVNIVSSWIDLPSKKINGAFLCLIRCSIKGQVLKVFLKPSLLERMRMT